MTAPAMEQCLKGDGNVAVKNGFCSECVAEIEKDIEFQDILPTRSKRAAMDARVRADDARIRQREGAK